MPITSIGRSFVGDPNFVHVITTDNLGTITSFGYVLTQKENIETINNGEFQWSETDLVVIYYSPSSIGLFTYDFSTQAFVPNVGGGGADLPTVVNRIAHFSDTNGTISSDPADVTNVGDINAGETGTQGAFISYSDNASGGRLRLAAFPTFQDDYQVTITNSNVFQDQIIAIPDADGPSANFLIDTGPSSVHSYEMTIPLTNFMVISPSEWTFTSVSDAEWYIAKTSNSVATYAIDVTEPISLQSSRGFSLTGFSIGFAIGSSNLVAHDIFLYKTIYSDNVIPSVTSIALDSGTLPIADRTNMYVVNRNVLSPLFNNSSNSKYVIQVTVNNSGSTTYGFFGITLRFDRTIP